MPNYYVNNNAQTSGDHEVHKEGCMWLVEVVSKTYLGIFDSCHVAVKRAKTIYPSADGCLTCCPDCHKR